MSDFESALEAKLSRNAELAREREEAERQMDRAKQEAAEAEARRERELRDARLRRHGELVDHLTAVAHQLKQASPEQFVIRMGWTESGEEFIAKISTRTLEPERSLFIELDRDDDEVLVRWHSDVGRSLELWRLLEVEPAVLTQLVLQAADQELWHRADGPPAFPE